MRALTFLQNFLKGRTAVIADKFIKGEEGRDYLRTLFEDIVSPVGPYLPVDRVGIHRSIKGKAPVSMVSTNMLKYFVEELYGLGLSIDGYHSGYAGKESARHYIDLSVKSIESLGFLKTVGVLLPLGMEASVQDQVRQARSIEDTLHCQIGQLNWQIMDYLADFKNTGVTRLRGSSGL